MMAIGASRRSVGTGSRLRALLGPTNTGKTHRAIHRMVEHGSGMIGLPLRLLAREVYDRVCALVDPRDVALLTGEERTRPAGAKYWVCTVESMPMTEAVPFVAVDEIQLATHPDRGHVFTDRLLNARGTRETWFMGSDTMRDLVERLTPTAEIETMPRLSSLSYVPPRRLSALPSRSVVVAFSAAQVYELADWLRAAQGGVAVVLGALSPRARNSQVAMFQSGEVQHLVATDAIGMGLNLDIQHVFFEATRKFDGRTFRDLEAWEMGQIAGRAGRFRTDGSWGLTRQCAERRKLPTWLIEAISNQRFSPTRKVYYRNSDLDLTSVDSLRDSLHRPPFAGFLIPARDMADERTLEGLLKLQDIARSVSHASERLATLWEVSQIPDFRQASHASHVRLVADLYRQRMGPTEHIGEEWMARRLAPLLEIEGSADALMGRIARIRTLAYVAHRDGWLANPDLWRERVLKAEEAVSDALHERLTLLFLDERAGTRVVRAVPHGVRLEGTQVITKTIALGTLEGLSFVPDTDAQRLFGPETTRKQGRRATVDRAEELVAELFAGTVGPPTLGSDLAIVWGQQQLGRLLRGDRLDRPKIRLAHLDLLSAKSRDEVRRRLDAWLKEIVEALLEPLPADLGGARGGLIYALRRGLGVVAVTTVQTQLDALTEDDRRSLARMDVRLGRRFVYSRSMLKPGRQALRAALWVTWFGLDSQLVAELPGGAPAPVLTWPDELAEAFGYPRLGRRCVRTDIAERVASHLRKTCGSRRVSALPPEPAQWLGCSQEDWIAIAAAMGYRPSPTKHETQGASDAPPSPNRPTEKNS